MMNENNLNTSPGTGLSMEQGNHKGSLIGSIIVVVLLIAGAIYLWTNRQSAPAPLPPETEVMENSSLADPNLDPQTETLNTQASEDDLSSIEADVNATDLSGLGAEIEQIEAELDNL